VQLAERTSLHSLSLFYIRHNTQRYTSAACRAHVSSQSITFLHQAQHSEVHKRSLQSTRLCTIYHFFTSGTTLRSTQVQLAERTSLHSLSLFYIRHNTQKYTSAACRAHVSAQSITFLHQAQHSEVHKRSLQSARLCTIYHFFTSGMTC